MKKIACLIFVIGVGLSLWACAPKQNESSPAIARVNGVPITAQQYREQAFYSPVMLTGLNLNNPDQRAQAAVESELLYQEAIKQKIMEQPQVRAQVEAIVIGELLRQDILRDQLPSPGHQPQISEEEAMAFYNANSAKYNQPAMVHYAQILIDSPDKNAAQALAQKILSDAKLNQPDEFAKLARQYSADKATANFGGDMGLVIVPPAPSTPSAGEFWQYKVARSAAAITEPGGVLPQPVTTERGLHIVKLISFQPSGPLPFEKVRPEIMRELMLEKLSKVYRAYIDKLKAGAQIDIDQQAMAAAAKEGFINPYSGFPRAGANPPPPGPGMNRPPGAGPINIPSRFQNPMSNATSAVTPPPAPGTAAKQDQHP